MLQPWFAGDEIHRRRILVGALPMGLSGGVVSMVAMIYTATVPAEDRKRIRVHDTICAGCIMYLAVDNPW